MDEQDKETGRICQLSLENYLQVYTGEEQRPINTDSCLRSVSGLHLLTSPLCFISMKPSAHQQTALSILIHFM